MPLVSMRYATVFLSALLSAGALQAEIDRTQAPAAGPAPEAAFPDYQTVTLPNGLKVFVIEDDRKPTLTLRLMIRSGSIFDGPKTGTARFVANMLNRCTEHREAP